MIQKRKGAIKIGITTNEILIPKKFFSARIEGSRARQSYSRALSRYCKDSQGRLHSVYRIMHDRGRQRHNTRKGGIRRSLRNRLQKPPKMLQLHSGFLIIRQPSEVFGKQRKVVWRYTVRQNRLQADRSAQGRNKSFARRYDGGRMRSIGKIACSRRRRRNFLPQKDREF